MCVFLYRKSCMILPNPETIKLQAYIADDTMCLDISNNLFQETNRSDDNLCVICLESNEKRRNITLQCEHTYHARCIIKWLSQQDSNNQPTSCPYCKQSCDGNELVKDIISTNITDVGNILKKLEYVTKYGSRKQQRAHNVWILKRNYSKLNSILIELQRKGVKEPLKCDYIYIRIVPLMENVLKLVDELKDMESNPEIPASNNCGCYGCSISKNS